MHPEITYDLKALITLFPTKEGGRKKSIFSGYKPSLSFSSHKNYSAEIHLVNKEELKPGESSIVIIKLLPARTIRKNLHNKDSFTLVEGDKAIGNGTIAEVLKKEISA